MGVCNSFMFCCTILYIDSSFAIIVMGKKELFALFSLSSWCLMVVVRLFLVVPWVCLQFVIVVFPNHTQLLFFPTLIVLKLLSQIFSYCNMGQHMHCDTCT